MVDTTLPGGLSFHLRRPLRLEVVGAGRRGGRSGFKQLFSHWAAVEVVGSCRQVDLGTTKPKDRLLLVGG